MLLPLPVFVATVEKEDLDVDATVVALLFVDREVVLPLAEMLPVRFVWVVRFSLT